MQLYKAGSELWNYIVAGPAERRYHNEATVPTGSRRDYTHSETGLKADTKGIRKDKCSNILNITTLKVMEATQGSGSSHAFTKQSRQCWALRKYWFQQNSGLL